MFYVNVHCNCRGYFGSVWTAVYQFWAHLILAPKLGKPGKKFFVKVNIDILHKYFSFLAYQRNVQFLHEMLDTLIAALTAFQAALALQTDRMRNSRIKHRNNFPIQAGKIIWLATTAQIIFLEQALNCAINNLMFIFNFFIMNQSEINIIVA